MSATNATWLDHQATWILVQDNPEASDMSYAAVRPEELREGSHQSFVGAADRLPLERVLHDADAANQEIDLRQLRHHTKNTLQRIISLIGEAPGLRDTPEGVKIARELEYRICLSATISNALFGFTHAPGSMAQRLRQLAGAMVALMQGADQTIRIGVWVRGNCPPRLREAVLRTAHELIGNAVKHGMKDRVTGRIGVRLISDEAFTALTVVDNGHGLSSMPHEGEGLTLARSLAASHGGRLRLESSDGTLATLEVPHWQ